MLKSLSIQNFAIIDSLHLEFEEGFNVLSGETGAGKSILVQALGLILGDRAYSELIRTGAEECEVHATFQTSRSAKLPDWLNVDLKDKEWQLSIKRVIQNNGKGKVWINQESASVASLQELAQCLMEIVGQNESQSFREEGAAQNYLDEFGNHGLVLREYQRCFENYRQAQEKLRNAETQIRQTREREDFYRFQLNEIAQAALKEDEEESLAQEKNILAHAGKLSETLHLLEGLLYSANDSAIELLGRGQNLFEKIEAIDSRLSMRKSQLQGIVSEVDDFSRFLQDYARKIDFDPQRLDEIESRLELLHSLQKKYSRDVTQLLEWQKTLEVQLGSLEDQDLQIEELRKVAGAAHEELLLEAEKLTQARKVSGKKLSQSLSKELELLSMPKTRFEVRFEVQEPGLLGADQISFWMSPNSGEELKPLEKIASGGELSRILLALKSIQVSQVKAYLFDEVDTGIGGAVAEAVGNKLKKISESSQVICITHLPQVASLADVHYRILKSEKKGRVNTQIKRLDEEGREEEIARMLAGVKITEQARMNAREMLKR